MSSFEIHQYNKRDLSSLLAKECFWSQPQLPITKRRAISQLANPRSDDSDLVLVAAFNKGQLIAYCGILPDVLRIGQQAPVKFGWGTTWWVDKQSEYRGYAAIKILFTAMERYCQRIAMFDFSVDSKQVFDATRRFQEVARLDVSYFMLTLPPSWPVAGSFTRWIAAKHHVIFGRKLEKHGLRVQTIDSFDESLMLFVSTWAAEDPTARDLIDWHWILHFPWVSPNPEDQCTQKRYTFSSFAKDFRQIPLVVSRDGKTLAFLFMTLRNGRLRLKYAYYDPAHAAEVAIALQAAIARIGPWVFISADTAINLALKREFPFHVAVRNKCSFAYRTKGLPLSLGPRPQLGMGDAIFT